MRNARHSKVRWGLRCALVVAVAAAPVLANAAERHVPVATKPTPGLRVADAAPGDARSRDPKMDAESRTSTAPFLEVALDSGSGGTVGDAVTGPPLARLSLGGTTTWRNYCARPGVKSCGAYDRLPASERLGDTVSYSTSVPYLGFSAELELLPLARSPSLLQGVGLVLGYRHGFASTHVTLVSDAGRSTTREVAAADSVLTAQALYRYFFGKGAPNAQSGYVGLRGGLLTRAFNVDASADSPLTGTHRVFPAVGLEVSVPLVSWARVEGAGQLYLSPRPGRSLGGGSAATDAELSDYGTSVSSSGWEAELGMGGDIWGPFGYSVRFRLARFQDTFTGAGRRLGWDEGGVAAETYSSLHWGITASY